MKCEDCLYFVPLNEISKSYFIAEENVFKSDTKFGRCHCNPPTANQQWPITLKSDFCGQFKQKEIK